MVICQLQRNSWIPVVFSTLLSTGIILSFILAYAKNGVKSGFPHISDTASQQPQSGIFCIFLFLSAFAAFLCMMVRYASVTEGNVSSSMAVNVINKLSLLFGTVSLGGMMVVGAYPLSDPPVYILRTEWRHIATRPHSIAAIVLFSCVNAYCFLHTILTIIQRKREGIVICYLRVAIFIFTVSCYITMKIYGARHSASKNCKDCFGSHGNQIEPFRMNVTLPGESKEAVALTDADKSAISELGLAVCLVIYFLTFVKEFRHVSLSIVTKYEAQPHTVVPTKNYQMSTYDE
uniref:DNA damage-regulated autophagy modulator protein 1 n=1 Tax=Hadrurus spadix TaxID=141984 RepID=A0A1W7RAX0_9SCOR